MMLMTPINVNASSGVYEKMISLQNKFPNGKHWNHYVANNSQLADNLKNRGDESFADTVTDCTCNSHTSNAIGVYDCNHFDGGIQCCGFARKIFFDVFGQRVTALPDKKDKENISPGDYISLFSGGHYAVVLSRNGNTLYVVECNLSGLNGNEYPNLRCSIRWNHTYDISDVDSYRHATNWDAINGGQPIGTPVDLGSAFDVTITDAWGNSMYLDSGSIKMGKYSYSNRKKYMWRFEALGNNAYRISNWSNEKYIDCAGAGSDNGNIFQTFDWNDTNAQKYYIYDMGNGYYSLEPACARGKALDKGGTNGTIHLWEYSKDNYNQLFKFSAGVNNADIGSDFNAKIVKGTQAFYENSSDDVVLKEFSESNNRFIWNFKRNSDGSYTVTNLNDKKALDCNDWGKENGANIGVFDSYGSTAQKWNIYDVDKGFYVLEPQCSPGRVADLGGNNLSIHLWEYGDENGNQRFMIISDCSVNGHTWDEGTVTKEVGCVNVGIKTYNCMKCKASRTEEIPASGHSYDDEVILPTKTAQGYTLHTCSICGDTYKDNYTDCDGDNPDPIHTHTYSFEITKASTCTEKGIKEYTCSCGDSYTEDIPATGHKLASTVIEPTDENDGYTLHKCTNEGCDYEYKDNIVPHKTSEDVHQHKYVGKITKEPTCVEAGTMTYSCECGVSYTEGISAKGHSYEDQIIAPTPESRGYTLHTCSICNDSYKDTYTEYEDSSEVSTDIRLETEVKNGKIYFSWNVPDKAATYGIVYALDEQELDFAEKNNGYEISGVKANSDTMTYECATTLYENQPGGVWFRVVMKNGDIVEHSNAVKITKWNSERTDDGTDDDPKDTPKDSPEGNPSADPIDKQPQNSGDAQTTDQGVTHTSEKKVLPSVNITNGVGIYNGIKLYWKAVAGAAGYEVEYSVNSDLSNSKIDYLDYSSLGVYRVRNLLGNKVYYYRVRARRGTEGAYDYSEWTSIQKLTTMEEVTTETPTTTYSVPKIKLKSVKNNKRKTVTVKWKWNVKADGYQISYAKKKSFSGAKKKNANAYKESMTIKKLTKGKTYYVRVRAYVENEYGGKIYGKWSNVKKVKIKK